MLQSMQLSYDYAKDRALICLRANYESHLSKKVFSKKTNHIRHIHIAGKRDRDNSKMERLNGKIRDREKVFRGLKKFDTPLIDGLKAYYNFTKKHGSLKGRTPAEEALIEVDGKNKWITLIQNTSLHKENSV